MFDLESKAGRQDDVMKVLVDFCDGFDHKKKSKDFSEAL